MALTNMAIRQAQAASRPYKLNDSRGLYLLVMVTGSKSWRYKYGFGGKERLLTLGLYPGVSLADARSLQEEARRMILTGKDPAIEAKRKKQARIVATDATFKKMAEIWLEERVPHWSQINAKRVRYRFEKDIYPSLGSVPIASIDGPMVLSALRKIEKRGSIATAKRIHSYIRSIFVRARGEHLVSREILDELDDIRDGLKPKLPARPKPALINLAGLREFQQCIDGSTANVTTKLASRFLALTVVRSGVLCSATWQEFEGIDWSTPDALCEHPIWRIPSERMKLEVGDKGNAAFGHDVPLSTQAVETLRALRLLSGAHDYLFPHARTWRRPMTDAALSALYRRVADGGYRNHMVPHGWRAAFSTLMNERAAELDRHGDRMIIDMILAHLPLGVSASEWAYNRARYIKQQAQLNQVWADMISDGLQPALTLVACDQRG